MRTTSTHAVIDSIHNAVSNCASTFNAQLRERLVAALAEGRVVGYASLVVNQRGVLLAAATRRPVVFMRMGLSGRAIITMIRYAVRKIAAEFLGHKWPAAGVAASFKAGSELRSIAVMPEWCGRGIAVRLLDAAVGHAASKAWTPVVAWVEKSNTPSASAFLEAGFRVAAQRVDENGTVKLYSWSSPQQDTA